VEELWKKEWRTSGDVAFDRMSSPFIPEKALDGEELKPMGAPAGKSGTAFEWLRDSKRFPN
jgi:hypothetical protein